MASHYKFISRDSRNNIGITLFVSKNKNPFSLWYYRNAYRIHTSAYCDDTKRILFKQWLLPAAMGGMGKIISTSIFIDALGVEMQEIVYGFGFTVFCSLNAEKSTA